jgi:hypothetical protein
MDELNFPILSDEHSAQPPTLGPPGIPEIKNLRTFTARDWDDQKENITRLYVEENRTLKDVMYLIEGHYGLRATYVTSHLSSLLPAVARRECLTELTPFSERMYKRRIEKWRLDKNNKLRDMTAIVRIQRQRESDGKETRFRVRGRPVDLEEVSHYMKRRKLRQQASPVPTTSDPGRLVFYISRASF